MRRIEMIVFIACVITLAGWMAFGPERFVHRNDIAFLIQRR